MKDLTQGSVTRHILGMAAPIAAGMVFQTLYYLVDLYFVAGLGDTAIAGVSAAGNATFLVFALTQVLGVGTVALISHAAGRKDREEATLIFNQSVVLSAVVGVTSLVGGYALIGSYMRTVAADEATVAAGVSYLYWFMPGLALQFAMVAMSSALRGTGIVRPTILVQIVTVLLNIVLAPVLIAGWLTGRPLGVAGAGLASSIAIAAGVVLLGLYFARLETFVTLRRDLWRPQLRSWRRMLGVGLPAGGELVLMFVYMAFVYWAIRGFGADAQAGYGVGSRIMQAIFLPAMAVAFAAGPVAGQNFGARHPQRVRATFVAAAWISTGVMLALTVLMRLEPRWLVAAFTDDVEVIALGATFLEIASLNFVAQGLIFTCSSMFQGLGDTRPALLSTGTRLVTFVLPVVWLSGQPFFRIEHLWYLWVATVTLQALTSLVLLRLQLRSRLPQLAPVVQPG